MKFQLCRLWCNISQTANGQQQENLANAKVSEQQQCVYEGP